MANDGHRDSAMPHACKRRRQRWVIGELAGDRDHVAVLQEHQPAIAVVVGERAERFRAQRDLRVELQRGVEQRQGQYTPHMPSIEISSINSSSSMTVSSADDSTMSSFSMNRSVVGGQRVVPSGPCRSTARVGDPVDAEPFPELVVERDHLSFARAAATR